MSLTTATIAAMREALGKSLEGESLAKAGVNIATGLTWYDLRAPALLHIPMLTPLRDKLARKSRPNPGEACNWKTIVGMTGSGYDNIGYVPEGARSGVKSLTVVPRSASYVTLGEEGRITFQAKSAAQGLDDAAAIDRLLTLEKVMLKEEPSLLYGNKSIRLGTPSTPVLSAPTVAGSALGAANYYVAVVALTPEGFGNSSLAGGVATALTVTGADGASYTVNGGSPNKSAITAAQAVSSGQGLVMTTAALRGAVGYAWFVGTTGAAASLYLQAITTVNTFTLAGLVTVGRQTADTITADRSYNDGTQSGANPVSAYDGLMTSALISGSGSYYRALATGSRLTPSNTGGVEEIDEMLMMMWDTYKVSVTDLWMSARTARELYRLILTNGSAPLLRVNKDSNDGGMNISGGGTIDAYFHPVSVFGGMKIPVRVHPNLPDGVILGYASELPAWYKNNETPATAEVLTRQDYFSMDWPKRTLADEYGVYTDQCLAVYAPWSMGVISNITI